MTSPLSPRLNPPTLNSLLEEAREYYRQNSHNRPFQWVATGRTFALIHIDELANQSPLGIFIEFRSPRDRSARRLVPAPGDHIYTELTTEFVKGALWLYPKPETVDIPVSAFELSALKMRFWELIEELEQEKLT